MLCYDRLYPKPHLSYFPHFCFASVAPPIIIQRASWISRDHRKRGIVLSHGIKLSNIKVRSICPKDCNRPVTNVPFVLVESARGIEASDAGGSR
jgi:hypothetical protein